MITKREVLTAIARSEYLATTPLDRSQVQVERGDLTVLIEAAKRADFVNMHVPTHAGDRFRAKSDSEMVLPEVFPVIDLDKDAWEQIKKAAASGNLPAEYMMNDWVSDVCAFLRGEIKGSRE